MKDFRFCSGNVVSVSSVCEDPALREAIITSDAIRAETLRRCEKIPSYKHKSLEWKNRYYDLLRQRIRQEIAGE